MAVDIVVFAEARADCQLVTELADRVILEDPRTAWIKDDPKQIDSERRYVGIGSESKFAKWTGKWKENPKYKRQFRIRAWGKGRGLGAEYLTARKAILATEFEAIRQPSIKAVILSRDVDKDSRRHAIWEQVRADLAEIELQIILAAQTQNREAWVLNGFVPQDESERSEFEKVRHEIGFDPAEEAHRLTGRRKTNRATGQPVKKSSKRVLNALTNDSNEREQQCWAQTPLERLRANGKKSRLTQFLDEVHEKLIPLLRG